MKAPRYFVLTFFLQVLYFSAFPQIAHINFEHIGTGDGLSNSNVLCILQDNQGFMWFGTRDGLNKYDGYKFTIYKNEAKDKFCISNNYIQHMVESKNGYLWIATLGGGLNRYDRKKNQFISFRHDKKNRNSIASDFLNTLLEDSEGNIWIGTSDGGLDMFDVLKNHFTHHTRDSNNLNSLSDVSVTDIFEDSQRNLWIATPGGGLNLFNRKNNTFTHFKHDKNNSKSISSNNVYAMFEDSKHRFWVGTNEKGLNLFNRNTGEFFHFKHDVNNNNSLANDFVYAINEDNANNLWIGTENGGLSIFNPVSGSFQTYQNNEFEITSLGNNSIYAIYRDTKNNLWIGNFNAGIDFVSSDKGEFLHYKQQPLKNSLSNNNVLCIYEGSDKNIWIGTDGGGINLFNPATDHFTNYRHNTNDKNSICGDYVLSICEDDKGNLWVGTWTDGITVFNRRNNTFRHFKNDPANPSSLSNNNIWAIFKDADNHIWIGTFGGGMELFDAATNSFKHFKNEVNNNTSISGNQINFIKQVSSGKLWIGTNGGGLNLFDQKTKVFTHYFNSNSSIAELNLYGICETRDKNVWISTSGGLYLFNNKTSLLTLFTKADGLPDNMIFGILEDEKSNLWISTSKGISRFNPVTKEFKNFTVADGLQGVEFKEQAYCKSSSGAMYFGGNNGFNVFFPENIKPISFEPPLVITNFQVFNKDVQIATDEKNKSPLKVAISEAQKITLPYESSVFTFEFATLNYVPAGKKQYAYMLEGFDNNWNETGTNHTATYTNLDPGTYTFKVKGLNNEGKWSTRTITLILKILPPFWLTWWFRALLIVTALSFWVIFYRVRVHTIKSWARKLELQVSERTAQLAHAIKEEQKARQEAEHARSETDHANKNLERKNKEMEQFAYIVSHDLQEPIRTTSSFAALLQKQYAGKLDEKAGKYFTFIIDASDRMKELIKNLLEYSRIGNNKELEKIDCEEILNNVVADLAAAISEAGATIKHDPLPVVSGYSTELKQLFQNLLTNAIKFKKKDIPPEVNISVQNEERYWHFAFKDNGIGIDEKHNEKIFVIFQRLHTRSEYEGTGIGLSHCKKIVELHKGRIWVESIPGSGSTFHFTILAWAKSNVHGKDNAKVPV